ncbi:DNA-binding protein hgh1 [Apiospora kogelbergensis]|uniref:DNA-binding protein hgh1 n=1 Tax=Apiospora kogelbergensis TaxID=1337665 RepID=UPI00312D6E23
MPTELEELVGFIANPSQQIRLVAIENLVPYSLSQPDIFKADKFVPIKNLKLLVKDHPQIAEHVLTILINLSADREVLENLATDETFLDTILSYVTLPNEPNANLLSMLLANLAKWDAFQSILARKQPPPKELGSDDLVMNQLMDLFVKGAEGTYNKDADYDHLVYLFADLTKHAELRHYFVRKQDYDGVIPITKLKVFTEHKSHVRRKGVASTIKNVAFDVPSHPAFLAEDDINILPYVLLPIIGNEEFDEEEAMAMLPDLQLLPPDKERDSDPTIIQTHLETLLLLTSTREARDLMRSVQVYPVIRELHKKVADEGVGDACERLANMLMRDEEDAPTQASGGFIDQGAVEDDDDDDKVVEV